MSYVHEDARQTGSDPLMFLFQPYCTMFLQVGLLSLSFISGISAQDGGPFAQHGMKHGGGLLHKRTMVDQHGKHKNEWDNYLDFFLDEQEMDEMIKVKDFPTKPGAHMRGSHMPEHPPAGGRGGFHPPGGPFPPFPFEKYIHNITCPVADDQPKCQPPRPRFWQDVISGTWVCRTVYNPVTGEAKTNSACIDDKVALITDQCGCCEPDGCPAPCTCTCKEGHGVLVDFKKESPDGEEVASFTKCVPPEVAISVVAMDDHATCHTTCSN